MTAGLRHVNSFIQHQSHQPTRKTPTLLQLRLEIIVSKPTVSQLLTHPHQGCPSKVSDDKKSCYWSVVQSGLIKDEFDARSLSRSVQQPHDIDFVKTCWCFKCRYDRASRQDLQCSGKCLYEQRCCSKVYWLCLITYRQKDDEGHVFNCVSRQNIVVAVCVS